jgi:hypothetical protein
MYFKCGKLEHVWDARTIQFADFMRDPVPIPTTFDFDKGRTEFPLSAWGSERQKCDVVASQANQLLRFGRIEEKRTIPLESQDVIRRYRSLARVKKSGDENDIGLSALNAMKRWQKQGWMLKGRNHKILAYGELDPRERDLLRTAIYFFRGIHLGFWLTRATSMLTTWDFTGEIGEDWKAGTLGGCLAYCKAYNEFGYQILYQGKTIFVTNEFVDQFSDECWVCIEEIDYWIRQALDIEKLSVLLPALTTDFREEE